MHKIKAKKNRNQNKTIAKTIGYVKKTCKDQERQSRLIAFLRGINEQTNK